MNSAASCSKLSDEELALTPARFSLANSSELASQQAGRGCKNGTGLGAVGIRSSAGMNFGSLVVGILFDRGEKIPTSTVDRFWTNLGPGAWDGTRPRGRAGSGHHFLIGR